MNGHTLFIGIDLGLGAKPTTGVCVLEEVAGVVGAVPGYCWPCSPRENGPGNGAIIGVLSPFLERGQCIAIDAPLVGPAAGAKIREAERFFLKGAFGRYHINPIPCGFMMQFTERGIALRRQLEDMGFSYPSANSEQRVANREIIEVFPTLALGLLLKADAVEGGKKTEPKGVRLYKGLIGTPGGLHVALGLEVVPCPKDKGHLKMAFVSALLARAHAKGFSSFVGSEGEGAIYLPHYSLWDEFWRNSFDQVRMGSGLKVVTDIPEQ